MHDHKGPVQCVFAPSPPPLTVICRPSSCLSLAIPPTACRAFRGTAMLFTSRLIDSLTPRTGASVCSARPFVSYHFRWGGVSRLGNKVRGVTCRGGRVGLIDSLTPRTGAISVCRARPSYPIISGGVLRLGDKARGCVWGGPVPRPPHPYSNLPCSLHFDTQNTCRKLDDANTDGFYLCKFLFPLLAANRYKKAP